MVGQPFLGRFIEVRILSREQGQKAEVYLATSINRPQLFGVLTEDMTV